MKKILYFIVAFSLGIYLQTGCKKKQNNRLSPFADSLRRTCTQPFVGPIDSSKKVYLPTAFTPNGNGIDDICRIIGNWTDFAKFQMTVYDTAGMLVFQTNDPTRSWFGTDTATGKLSTKYKFYVEVAYTTLGNISYSAGTYLFLLSSPDPKSPCVNIVPADTSKYEFIDQFDTSGFIPGSVSFETYCN